MKRVSLAALATLALIGATACQDAVTSPQNGDLRYGVSNPPPPKIDTGATGSFTQAFLRAEPTGLLRPRYTILGAPHSPAFEFSQTPFFFSIPVQYFFNTTQNAGFLHYMNDPDGVDASSNGMVKYSKGNFSGKGILTIQTSGGPLIIYLASVDDDLSFFGPCGDELPPCFHVFFNHATLDGVDGSVDTRVGCKPSDFDNEDTYYLCYTD